jgi:ketosteroid isomerase-like protein
MMRTLVQALMLVTLCASAGCATSSRVADLEQHLRDRVQNDYIAPFKSGDVDRWMQIFAEHAVGMHNTVPPLEGRDAIRKFGEMVRDNLIIGQMDVTVDEVRQQGNWAWTRGSYVTRFLPRNAPPGAASPPATKGKFMMLWERQRSGEWQVILDMGNSNERPASQ